uniref:Pco088261 n=1 Tax=Arundo donax TaxID=35708 RepID=A0A0A9EA83_ARUDO
MFLPCYLEQFHICTIVILGIWFLHVLLKCVSDVTKFGLIARGQDNKNLCVHIILITI